MRDQEEVELAINDLGLLDEAGIHICALRRIEDHALLVALIWCLLEESLADSLVDNDECHFWESDTLALGIVLVC